jgi:hypothetical protein
VFDWTGTAFLDHSGRPVHGLWFCCLEVGKQMAQARGETLFYKRGSQGHFSPSTGDTDLVHADHQGDNSRVCFKTTLALRVHYHYRGVSAEVLRRGYGSSRPELAWANRQRQPEPEKPLGGQNKSEDPQP